MKFIDRTPLLCVGTVSTTVFSRTKRCLSLGRKFTVYPVDTLVVQAELLNVAQIQETQA